MCGISGIFSPKADIDIKTLQSMAMLMNHRGPDFTGLYVSSDRRVGLAHNRLAILDLTAAGNQPMRDLSGYKQIVFNGEIYNFLELRRNLQKEGHIFKSDTDTEVILNLYEKHEINSIELLNGIFAFCIHDENNHKFLLARDRVGVKPLYYVYKNGNFAFASEPKALLALPFVSRELNVQALDAYFTIGYIPSELCIFREMKKLKPAHYLTFDYTTGELSLSCYWNVANNQSDLTKLSALEISEMLESTLRDAVRIQMISDVPIGSFLSGGIDSSIVSTLMAEITNTPIKTFNISFESVDHDESPYARIVAQNIESNHTETRVKMDAASSLFKLINNFDEPFSDSSMIPTYCVSKIAKEQVTVVLSGDGGDELFGGYNWYSWVLQLQSIRNKFGPLSTAFKWLGRIMPKYFIGKHFLSSIDFSPAYQFLERIACFQADDKINFYHPEFREVIKNKDFRDDFMRCFEEFEGDLLQKMTRMDFHCYLPDDILTKVDRASMAVSLEARVPWLDHRLVELAFSIPSSFIIHDGTKKYLPKLLAKKLLPVNLPLERKKGFSVPLQQWMSGDLGLILETLIHSEQNQCYIDCKKSNELLQTFKHDKSNQKAVQLYAILVFLLWHNKYAN